MPKNLEELTTERILFNTLPVLLSDGHLYYNMRSFFALSSEICRESGSICEY